MAHLCMRKEKDGSVGWREIGQRQTGNLEGREGEEYKGEHINLYNVEQKQSDIESVIT